MVIAVRMSSTPTDFSIFALTHIRKGNVAHVSDKKRMITAYNSAERSSVEDPVEGAETVVAIATTQRRAVSSVCPSDRAGIAYGGRT